MMIDFEQGIVNTGAWSNIRSVMDRASDGNPITVGFLGGSITQGSLSSSPETCYAYLVYRWWVEHFPKSRVTYVNAGIGGTNSQFGVARVTEDLLVKAPDFVLAEFSVNDDNLPHFQETYEGLVRSIIKSGAAMLLMCNVCYDSGVNAEEQHIPVARHYDIPMVSMKPTIYAALQRGELNNRQITPDDLHPNDMGHALVAQCICYLLEKIRLAPHTEMMNALPAPISTNRYESSCRYQNHNSSPVLRGFEPDNAPQEHLTQCFRRGFTAWHKDNSIVFDIYATCISVQYRKSVTKPTPIAEIIVDGDEAHSQILDGNFQENWGDCLYLQTVYEGIAPGDHTVEIRIVEAHDNDVVPFYLVSVIGS